MTHRLHEDKPLLICVCGATATGKTELAFALASALKTEIISFDSVQVYRHFNIGTAKPEKTMLKQIKHHFIDQVEPASPFTAGDFRRGALEVIERAKHKFNVFVLVGGTGFYLQALLRGMFEIPPVAARVKQEIENELQTRGLAALFAEVQRRDPEYAARIHVNDTYRVTRALELLRSGSQTVTQIKAAFSTNAPSFGVRHIGLKREKGALLKSVTERTHKMLDAGLIEETENLLARYAAPAALDLSPVKPVVENQVRALDSVGYRETRAFLRGELNREELAAAIIKNTMALAKRQQTWFKREAHTQWFDADENRADALAKEILTGLI